MKVEFDKSFHKKLGKIADKSLLEKVRQVILQIESAGNIQEVKNAKNLRASRHITGLG